MLQDEMIPGAGKDQEALLLSVQRPVMFVQPVAFDKGMQYDSNLNFTVIHYS